MNDKIKEAFDGVHAEDALKRNTKAFLAERISASERPRRANGRRLAAALVCFALVLVSFGGWRFWATPVAAISVDSDSSVELGVNRFDKVVSVTADGIEDASGLKNLDYSDAIDALLSGEELSDYVGGGEPVSITVIGRSEEKSEEMRARISACGYASAGNVECRSGDPETAAAARAAGLSYGKYQAYLELKARDESVTPDEIRDMTMREIRDMLGEACDAPHGGGQYHGGR